MELLETLAWVLALRLEPLDLALSVEAWVLVLVLVLALIRAPGLVCITGKIKWAYYWEQVIGTYIVVHCRTVHALCHFVEQEVLKLIIG